MNGVGPLSRITEFAAEAGEFAHYSAALWVAFVSGGVELAGIYLIAVTIPGAIYRTGRTSPPFLRRLGGLVSPAGLVALWGLSSAGPVPPAYVVALALSIGGGAALAGRPVAFSSTLNAGPGIGSVVGATAALAFAVRGQVFDTLALAAGLTFLSSVVSPGEFSTVRAAPPVFVRAAQLALAFTVGMRVVEPVIIRESARAFDPEPVSSSLFAAAWVAGAAIGWRAAPQLDARVVLSAPFAAAAALAALGALSGPAMVTAWGIVGSCAGTMGGSGPPESSDSIWPRGRLIMLTAAFSGTLFTALWLGSESGFEFATGTAAAVLIASGFIGLAAARRVPLPPPPAPPIERPSVAVAPRIAGSELEIAVNELKDALDVSRSIRSGALAVYRASGSVPTRSSDYVRVRAREVVDTTLSFADQTRDRIRGMASLL